MAKKDPPDELDDEIAELEKEIAALEEGDRPEEEEEQEEGSSIKDRLPFSGGASDDEQDEPSEEPETADEEDSSGGRFSGLMSRFSSSEEDPEADEADEGTQAADQDSDESGDDAEGGISGLVGRFRGGDEDDTEEPAEEEIEAPDVPEEEAEETQAPSAPETRTPEQTEETEAPAPEAEPATRSERPSASSARWERTEEGWRRRDPEEVPAEAQARPEADDAGEPDDAEDADGGVSGAAALLSRFRSGSEEEDEEEEQEDAAAAAVPPEDTEDEVQDEEEEEDEERSKLVFAAWIVGAIVLIALIAAAALWLLGGGGGADVQAALASDAIQQDGAYVASTGAAIALDASGTTGTVDEYRWDFGDGETTTTSGPTVEHTYASAGGYTVTLTAVAGDTTSEATLQVTAFQAPQPDAAILLGGEPVAEAGQVGNNVFIGQTVTLDGSGSSADPDLGLASFAWDVDGDGSADANQQEATTSFDSPGRWLVNLTVTDDLGFTATASQPVHVSDIVAFENETIGAAATGDQTAYHNISVDAARLGAIPIQLEANLTYDSSADDPTGQLPQTGTQSDLDLVVVGPGGTEIAAQDDEGTGSEMLTVTQSDIGELGEWSFRVIHDQDQGIGGSANEVTYTIVIQTRY